MSDEMWNYKMINKNNMWNEMKFAEMWNEMVDEMRCEMLMRWCEMRYVKRMWHEMKDISKKNGDPHINIFKET